MDVANQSEYVDTAVISSDFFSKMAAYAASCIALKRLHLRGLPLIPKACISTGPGNRKAYNNFIGELVRLCLRDSPLIIDAGANHGDFALACSAAYAGAEVHLFEPLDTLWPNLEKLRETGGFNWILHRCALGSLNENSTLQVADSDDGVGTLGFFNDAYLRQNLKAEEHRSVHCSVRKLDSIDALSSDARTIDLLKIDVEGFEFEVLSGAQTMLPRVRNIIVEVSLLRHAEEGGNPVTRMLTLLESHGLRLNKIQPTLFALEDPLNAVEFDIYARSVMPDKTP